MTRKKFTIYLLFNCLILAAKPAFSGAPKGLWCDGPYDEEHPLAYAAVLQNDRIRLLLEENEWRDAENEIFRLYTHFIYTNKVDRTSVGEFTTGFRYYLTKETQEFAQWAPIEPGGNEMLYVIPQGEGMDTALIKVSCDNIAMDAGSAAIAYTAATLAQAAETYHLLALKIAEAKVTETYATYHDLLFNGLPMWPWETWVNGMNVDFSSTDPALAPRSQWVLMRPSLSPALKFDGNEDSELDAGFLIEPFGYVHYTRPDYKEWWGVSPLVSFTNSNGVGYGGLFRYNNWEVAAAYLRQGQRRAFVCDN